ncbi:hypothetical protein [Cyanobacterium sp. Dongsha4]|uniref:hypothetical protein n=1 Tax=Cyanobacterium sp. DS4 TaxID=2878255 RepID=UPI002E7FFDFB|nr:hypothetical protein [Cyanobacterium sp. Dongsha4]WVL02206.1 hypothetical protein Dongsha4_08445 [Cyanobacterium sp. Dongsha4]
MLKAGIAVKIINPEYVRGFVGYLLMQESSSRWLVKVIIKETHLPKTSEMLVLSLEESDFEILHHSL